jgi:peptide methionine sulfoxide reductase MsrA
MDTTSLHNPAAQPMDPGDVSGGDEEKGHPQPHDRQKPASNNNLSSQWAESKRPLVVCCLLTALVVCGVAFYEYGTGDFMVPPKRPLSNDPNSSVYFGFGCFWHAQYDMFMVERAEFSPPRREDSKITSLVGYAGGLYTSEDGLVCYHGGPRGSLYSDNGHAEVVQVQLDSGHEPAQFSALAGHYFSRGFQTTRGRDEMRRLDPQDAGPAYRNVVGIPGGMNGKLFPLLRAANAHNMPLVQGGADGGRGDEEDEYQVLKRL